MIDLPPSQIVLERSLGSGERAEVFLAQGGRFAIKRYFTKDQIPLPAKELTDYYYDASGVFLGAERELEIAQRLRHPNVIRIYSVFFDGVTTYLVMDYVEGKPLDFIVTPKAAKEVIEVLRLALQENLIHRDLYNENFILDSEGKVYFIDLDSFEEKEDDEDWDDYAEKIFTFVGQAPPPSGLKSKEDLEKALSQLDRMLSS